MTYVFIGLALVWCGYILGTVKCVLYSTSALKNMIKELIEAGLLDEKAFMTHFEAKVNKGWKK